MDSQQIISLAIVALATLLLVRRQIRRRRRAKASLCGRGADCLCGATHASYSEQITYKLHTDTPHKS